MSHQDLIDYINSIKATNNSDISGNNDGITSLTTSVATYNDLISSTNSQIAGIEAANAALVADNHKCDDIIALLSQ